MKVKALKSFVGTVDGVKHRVQADEEFILPKGADWLAAGLVAAVETPKPAKKASSRKKKSS